jgi:single-strand DNA-binding protein
MPSVNRAILVGHLGRDPELRYTPNGAALCKFSIATTERYKEQETTTWHNIVAWNKTAEICSEYLKKGAAVYIEGRISNRKYQDQNGNDRYISEIVAERVQFLSKASGRQDEAAAKDDEDIPF